MSEENPLEFKILILDNGAFHHAKSLQIPDNINFVFLPPYSRELNPAQKEWRHFKDRIGMIAYNNLEMLQEKITEITNQIIPNPIKSICGNEFYKTTFKTVFNL